MQRAIEQAGSGFTGWISSCLFCLDSSGDDERAHHQQAMKQKSAEREMQICHSQPHLVPPMKLVVYDDLPSPGPPRASSFPTWVMEESKTIASRASSRPSMSFRRKSTAPVRISAPTDFRRVTTLPAISTVSSEYRPLELSFESPVNRLPDLPRFSDFGLGEDQPQQAPIARPPKALSLMTDFSYQTRPRTHRPSSSFNLPRKPVGSGSRRSSLATLELLMEKQDPISHPLIPHFSIRTSTASVATGLATTTLTSRPTWLDSTVGSPPLSSKLLPRKSHDATASTNNKIPKPTTPQDKSLPPIPTKNSLASGRHCYEPPATPVDNGPPEPSTNPSPSRSSRVTQWLLQQTTTPTSLSDKFPMRIRSRTLSGSTIAPSLNNIDTAIPRAFKSPTTTTATATPPLSHTTTAATMTTTTTARTSTLDSRLEKDFASQYPCPNPFAPRRPQSSTISDEHIREHPTIHEAHHQHHSPNSTNSNTFDYYAYDYHHDHHRHSAIGVAF
ncbi:hypothetical protein BJX76DRAFT_338120 [Aspergillus varians]